MLKKTLISLLVVFCVLGTVGTAFGAVFPDTAGTKYEGAVDLLSSLGLINGYPDGTFKPGNTISRAEFAKIAICAFGLEEAAVQAAGVTKFSDVPATHWAAGYVNIAGDLGLITGYPDGTFKPEAPVTYAEALTIIVRLLGYAPVVIGTWPTGYIVKAYEIGVASGVTFSSGSPATRGDAALFFKNALTIPLLEQVYSGALTTYAIGDPPKTILGDKLGYEAVSGWVTESPQVFDTALEEDQIEIDADIFEMAEGYSVDPDWLGLEVKAWLGEDGIVMVQVVTPAEDIIEGVITDYPATADIKIGKKAYDMSPDWVSAWHQNVESAWNAGSEGDYARAALDDEGDINTIYTWAYEDSVVVTKVTPIYDKFEGVNEGAGTSKFDLTVPDNYDAVVLLKDGQMAEIGDLAVGDVVYYYELFNGVAGGWYEVTSEKVSGEVESIETDADDAILLTVDGDEYTMAAKATLSTDDNDEDWAVIVDESDLAPFAGEEATLYLNLEGDVRHISGAVEAPEPDTFAGVVKSEFYVVEPADPTDDPTYFVKVFGTDGKTAKLELGEDTEIDGVAIDLDSIDTGGYDGYDAAYPVGTVVLYSVDDDGYVADLGDDDVPVAHTFDLDAGEIDEDARLVYGHRARSSTVFFHINLNDLAKWAVKTWDVFKTLGSDSACDGADLIDGDDATVDYLVYDVYDHGVTYGEAEAMAGVVTGRQVTADGVKVKVLTLDEDDNPVSASYLVNTEAADPTEVAALTEMNHGDVSDAVTDLDVGDYIQFEVDGEEFVTITEPLALDLVALDYAAYIEDWDADDLVVNLTDDLEDLTNQFEAIVDPEALVYDVTGTAELVGLEGVTEEQLVQVFDLNSDELIDLIKIIPEE